MCYASSRSFVESHVLCWLDKVGSMKLHFALIFQFYIWLGEACVQAETQQVNLSHSLARDTSDERLPDASLQGKNSIGAAPTIILQRECTIYIMVINYKSYMQSATPAKFLLFVSVHFRRQNTCVQISMSCARKWAVVKFHPQTVGQFPHGTG